MRSLFWKIFLTIMMVNISFVVANAYWVGVMLEKRYMTDQFFEDLEKQLVRIVDEYERQQEIRMIEKMHHAPRFGPRALGLPRNLLKHFQLEILETANGQALWLLPKPHRQVSTSTRTERSIQSSSGRVYTASYLAEPKLQASFWRILSRFGIERWVLTFMLAIIGSSILSSMIVAPLKRLMGHANALASGDLAARVEPRLVTRRDEVGQLAYAFNEMSDQIQKLLENQQSLLHDVSHELRAPLQRLQVAVELVRDQWQGDDLRLLDRQQREITKLHRMIDEILMLARLSHRDSDSEVITDFAESQQEEINVLAKVKSIVADLQPDYPSKNIRYIFEGEETGSAFHLNVDVYLFERVLSNILENAMKHTPVAAEIEIEVMQAQSMQPLQIIIRDNGPGVDTPFMKQLTKPFYRGPNTHPHKPGLGLGLSIAEKAMKRLNGDLLLATSPTGGLEVRVRFS